MSEAPEKTCDGCKHWHKEMARNGDPRRHGQCHRWHGGDGSGGYATSLDDVADNEVIVETDEGWGAMMGPKFGCVLWEAK